MVGGRWVPEFGARASVVAQFSAGGGWWSWVLVVQPHQDKNTLSTQHTQQECEATGWLSRPVLWPLPNHFSRPSFGCDVLLQESPAAPI